MRMQLLLLVSAISGTAARLGGISPTSIQESATASVSTARTSGIRSHYPIKQRRELETEQLSWADFEEWRISYSEDSRPKVLPAFYVDLFETSGDLSADSLALYETAMEQFLTAELGAVYNERPRVASVRAKVLSQRVLSQSVTRQRRLDDTLGDGGTTGTDGVMIGTQFETQVNVTFVNDPSPSVYAMRTLISSIMDRDMSGFVGNLSAAAGDDPALTPTEARYRGAEGDGVSITTDDLVGGSDRDDDITDDGVAGIIDDGNRPVEEDDPNLTFIVPILAAACILIALLALLVTRRRKQNSSTHLVAVDDDMDIYTVDGRDVFSEEDVVSPKEHNRETETKVAPSSPVLGSTQGDKGALEDGDDVFADLPDSPHRQTGFGSVFSFWSNFSRASTILASNRNKPAKDSEGSSKEAAAIGTTAGVGAIVIARSSRRQRSPENTPGSHMSSLYTSDEEDGVPDTSGSDINSTFETNATTDSVLMSPQFEKKRSFEEPSFHKSQIQAPTAIETTKEVDSTQFVSQVLKQTQDVSVAPQDEDSAKASSLALGLVGATALSESPDVEVLSPETAANDPADEKSNQVPLGGAAVVLSAADHESVKSRPQEDQPGSPRANKRNSVKLEWDSPERSSKNMAIAKSNVEKFSPKAARSSGGPSLTSTPRRSGRRHAKSTTGDGTMDYQAQTMNAGEAQTSFDVSLSDTETHGPSESHGITRSLFFNTSKIKSPKSPSEAHNVASPSSPASMSSLGSRNSVSVKSGASEQSASRKVIADLVWLEKKIADASRRIATSPQSTNAPGKPNTSAIDQSSDSLSFASKEGVVSASTSCDSTFEVGSPQSGSGMPQAEELIVCRDCFAPPGKLKIIIHSTKDGPAVHTVKDGSSLTGHVFAGDLIISVDDIDTRSFTAEQVMKMMTSRTKFERKITVLHFEAAVAKQEVTL